MKIHGSISISQPPEKIWEFWLPVHTDALWRSGITSAEWTSQPPYGEGSTGVHYTHTLGPMAWKILRWEEGRYTEFIHTKGKFKGSIASYRVEPENGSSKVSLFMDMKGPFIMRVILFFMKSNLKKGIKEDLQKLKDLLEEKGAKEA